MIEFNPHVHILPPLRQEALLRWMVQHFGSHHISPNVDEKSLVEDLLGSGVKRFFNLVYPIVARETKSINNWNFDFCSRTPSAIPVCSLHIANENKTAIAADLFERGSFGIKFHPFIQRFSPFDNSLAPVYEMMNERRAPLFLHTGYEQWYGGELPSRELAKLVADYPNMPVVFVHMLFPEIDYAFELVADHENLWLDATNVPSSFRFFSERGLTLPAGMIESFTAGVEKFSDRIMLGDDYPVALGNFADQAADIAALGLTPETIRNITGRTAAEFYERFRA